MCLYETKGSFSATLLCLALLSPPLKDKALSTSAHASVRVHSFNLFPQLRTGVITVILAKGKTHSAQSRETGHTVVGTVANFSLFFSQDGPY